MNYLNKKFPATFINHLKLRKKYISNKKFYVLQKGFHVILTINHHFNNTKLRN